MYSPFKMKGKSPMMKALIGKQNNLPAELKAKIEAAPESPAKMKKASPSKMKKKSPAKADNINSSGTNKENVKKIQEGIKGKTDKEKKGIVERNLANYHFKNSIPSAGADSVQAVLNTYLEEKNAPTKMKKKSSMKMMKKK